MPERTLGPGSQLTYGSGSGSERGQWREPFVLSVQVPLAQHKVIYVSAAARRPPDLLSETRRFIVRVIYKHQTILR